MQLCHVSGAAENNGSANTKMNEWDCIKTILAIKQVENNSGMVWLRVEFIDSSNEREINWTNTFDK